MAPQFLNLHSYLHHYQVYIKDETDLVLRAAGVLLSQSAKPPRIVVVHWYAGIKKLTR